MLRVENGDVKFGVRVILRYSCSDESHYMLFIVIGMKKILRIHDPPNQEFI